MVVKRNCGLTTSHDPLAWLISLACYEERNRKMMLTEEVWEDTMNAWTDGLFQNNCDGPKGARWKEIMLETSRQHCIKENPFNYQCVLLLCLTIPNLLIATEKPSHTDYTHFCTPVWDILITQEASIENC